MKRKSIMNVQLFGLGGISSPFFNADGGAGNGGSGTTTGGEGTNNTGGSTGEGAEGNEGDKSFDDVLKDKKYQSEFDKRVAKALETAKSKWETEKATELENAKTEAEKLAKMNAEQKAEYEQNKRIEELDRREKEITTRELRATAYTTLAEKNLPKELVEILNYEDAESCQASIENIEKIWTEANGTWQEAIAREVNIKLRGGDPPKAGQGNNNGTNFNFGFTGVRPQSKK
ncbi:DUF4355 domain-containing protein [Clostridium perfringens]|uniref:DUF4355 domain-containing protein n=1 Tax=Clostridium perfringens TaxID=1502 RepID=UPI002247ED57|nr:DUF4355 domain-containing protein [Clostridium perfringens]MCX0353271.1 DUF4355 domain-containing protein [Clostridium perfringens]